MLMHPLSVSMNPSTGGESGALSKITVYFFTHSDSLADFPVLPALSSQTYAKHALTQCYRVRIFLGAESNLPVCQMFVGKTYSNQHLA